MTAIHPPQGSNAERSRSRNRQAVLGHIHHAGVMGRAEIARSMGLSIQAVSNIIAELAGDGMLLEKGTRSAGRGLPAVQYAVNPGGGYSLGVEIRPDAVFAALLDMAGNQVFTERATLQGTDPGTVMPILIGLRDAALQAVPAAQNRLLGAGIVMPGPFGPTGLPGLGSDLPEWHATDPKSLFQDALGLSVELSNDANAAAMAERITGAAQGLTSYAYLYFGAGLGLGLVSQGHLIPGAFGNAGEIGHIGVSTRYGTVALETALSRNSVQNHLQQQGHKQLDFQSLASLYAASDPALMAWLENAGDALGHALQIIENLFDPQTVILGGAMPKSILDHLVSHVPLPALSVSNRPDSDQPRLRRGASGRLTATLGAAALILNRAFTPQIAMMH